MWPGLSTTLTGTRVVLAPLADAHRDGLRAAAERAGSATFRWMPADLSSPVAFGAWFTERRRALDDGAEAPFTTMEAESGRTIGSTSCLTLRPADRSLEIGRTWLEPAAWGSGAEPADVAVVATLVAHACPAGRFLVSRAT